MIDKNPVIVKVIDKETYTTMKYDRENIILFCIFRMLDNKLKKLGAISSVKNLANTYIIKYLISFIKLSIECSPFIISFIISNNRHN